MAEVKLGNGLILTHMNNARTRSAVQDGVASPAWGDQSSDRLGYDGAGRMIVKRFLDATAGAGGYSSTTALLGFTTAFDKASNKLYERHLHAENRSHLYPSQDSLGRLGQVQRGTLSQAVDGTVSVSSPITLPGADVDRTYTLDGLGNWRRTAHTPVGGAQTTEVRQHNPLNQITRFGTTAVEYDHGDNAADPDPQVAARGNGNIVNDGTRRYVYDAFNRLKEVYKEDPEDPGAFDVQIAAYTYDSLGRRVRKEIPDLGGGLGGLTGDIPAGTTDYVYSGIQCVEERNPFGGGGSTDTAIRHYVWGLYVDELVQQRDLGSPDVDYYPLADLLYRTHALTGAAKAIVEAYDYDAYGNTAIFTGAGLDSTWFTDDDTPADPPDPACRYLFTGREYDSETGIYWYRARYYIADYGRFTAADAMDYGDGMNPYCFNTGRPTVLMDPDGNQSMPAASPGTATTQPTTRPRWAPWPSTRPTQPSTQPTQPASQPATRPTYVLPDVINAIGSDPGKQNLDDIDIPHYEIAWGYNMKDVLGQTHFHDDQITSDLLITRINPFLRGKCCLTACIIAGEMNSYRELLAIKTLRHKLVADPTDINDKTKAILEAIGAYSRALKPWIEIGNAKEAISCLEAAIQKGLVGKIKCNETPDDLKKMLQNMQAHLKKYEALVGDKTRPTFDSFRKR
ncbi:MAG: tRNA nuclease WapA precursor [Planctomycetes bacterium ADurb.Bin126]|nr:MAG: tRNA nuclease WapA precursor [Planctomycetes bacterium ADurb.Bin126]